MDRTHQSIEVVPVSTGHGWRVCIREGERLQFVSGFAARTEAEAWARGAAPAWLAMLANVNGRL